MQSTEEILTSLRRRAEAARKVAAKRRSGPKGLGLDHYEEVARIYLTAPTRMPTVAVKDHFGVEITTANKWIERARHVYGLIPKTTPGKPSGQRDKKRTTRRKR
jgi:hypothetical protein